MLEQLIHALVESKNEAADEVLLEALRLGTEQEKSIAISGLFRRRTLRGLSGVVGQFDALPEALQLNVLQNVRIFHPALRECGRSEDLTLRHAALKIIALGRQGKLAYVLSENLHDVNDSLSKSAVDAMVALARWVSIETKNLHKGAKPVETKGAKPDSKAGAMHAVELAEAYHEIIENRPEIEAAVARALDLHRGKHGPDLLRAGMLLCDWPGSKTLAILHTAKHGGQSPMVRRMQQPPASEHVEAFLLGASHGGLRSHFGIVVSHIDEAPVLDALLRKTHWLKDHQLQLCMHQVTRGAWWGDEELAHDIERRTPDDAARIGEWIGASGIHDVIQDERLDRLRTHAREDVGARLRLLRVAARRKRGASVSLFRAFLTDPDERLMRMAAREIVRRRPPEMETMLLQLMTNAPESVRQVVSRAIGQAGFEHFWERFDRLDRVTRKQAGRAMLKILPDSMQRLGRRLSTGPVEQRLKAMQVTQELGLGETLRETLMGLINHPHPKVRSKAVCLLGDVPSAESDVLLEKVLTDADARVRANAIEVLESKLKTSYLPMLAQRARSSHNRERANAIKAMHRMKVGAASAQLTNMLKDDRSEHRISALWCLKQIGWWQLLNEVGRLAKEDGNLRVRRYALGVLRGVAEMVNTAKATKSA